MDDDVKKAFKDLVRDLRDHANSVRPATMTVVECADAIDGVLAEFGNNPAPNATDMAKDALGLVLGWVADDLGLATGDDVGSVTRNPHGSWFRILENGPIVVSTAEVNSRLKAESIPSDQVRRAWLDRGWLDNDTGSIPACIGNVLIRCIPITRAAAQDYMHMGATRTAPATTTETT